MAHEPRGLVLVGASGAEGLRQLVAFVGALPSDLPAAVLAVLHRPPDAPSALREILQRRCPLPVEVAEDGERLREGVCYLGRPDRHLAVDEGCTVRLIPDGSFRARNIDLLFATAAEVAGPRVLGVVLAGMLRDGAAGLAAIKRAGGRALVVDGEWGAIEGMPRAALRAVPEMDTVGGPAELAAAVVRRLHEDGE